MEHKQIIQNLEHRYAVKKFDNTKQLSNDQVQFLKKAISLTPTSYGLEPYKAIIITDKKLREQLKALSWNQTQITDASHLVVFASKSKITESDIDEFITRIAKVRGVGKDTLKQYNDMMVGSLTKSETISQWTKNQAYIVLGNTISALAQAGIDSCPMEGFNAVEYTKVLGLEGYTAAVVLAVGFRAADDVYAQMKKVRKSEKDLFIERK